MTIQELRHSLGMSQSKFADKFHLSVRTLQRWEQNQNPTPDYVLFMVSRIIELEDLVNVKQSD